MVSPLRSPRIALTVDVEHPDRPGCSPTATDEIVDVLGARGVRATFFLQGRWAEAYPATAARIARAGHRIGSHSHYHASLPLLTDEGLEADIREAERAIVEATGIDPRPWFRCPFGDGADDGRVLAAIARLGYRHAGWTVGTSDWRPGRTADEVASAIAAAADHSPAVVLVHGWPVITPTALDRAIEELLAGGAVFVGLDELRDDEIPATVPADADEGMVPA